MTDVRVTGRSEKSLGNQRHRLDSFVEWCEKNDLDNLKDDLGPATNVVE